jgi:hypothetical protein
MTGVSQKICIAFRIIIKAATVFQTLPFSDSQGTQKTDVPIQQAPLLNTMHEWQL